MLDKEVVKLKFVSLSKFLFVLNYKTPSEVSLHAATRLKVCFQLKSGQWSHEEGELRERSTDWLEVQLQLKS